MKQCSKCRALLPEASFSRNKSTKDGLQNQCKSCHRKCQDAWDEKNADYKRELGRRWCAANKDKKKAQRKASYLANRERILVGRRAWYQVQPKEKMRAISRRSVLRRYGLSAEEYARIFAEQGGKCAICGTAQGRKRLAIDHNHETGAVRALLCSPCNTGIGSFRESTERLFAAINYLQAMSSIERSATE